MADCATWWFDHVGETYIYVTATKQGDAKMQADAVGKLVKGTQEWEDLLKIDDAAHLMGDHVKLVKQLTDAAFTGDQATADASVEGLLQNAAQQSDLYEAEIPGFPKEEWERLFTTHITSTGGYILALASGDLADFKKNFDMTIKNRNQLAKFWGRLCLILKR